MMTLDDIPLEKMSDDEPLEHSVLDVAVTCRRVAGAPVLPPLQCSVMSMGLERGLRTEEKTLAAALQLQHDAGLILSNVQVLQ